MFKTKIIGEINPSPQTSPVNSSYPSLIIQPDEIRPNPDKKVIQTSLTARGHEIFNDVLDTPDAIIEPLVENTLNTFSGNHRTLRETFLQNYNEACSSYNIPQEIINKLSPVQKVYLGTIFTEEFTPEGAAKCNASIVLDPDQPNVSKENIPVIMAFRCISEGHISSISFAKVHLNKFGKIKSIDDSDIIEPPVKEYPLYHRETLRLKLQQIAIINDSIHGFLNSLPEWIDIHQLSRKVSTACQDICTSDCNKRLLEQLLGLAKSNFILKFDEELPLSSRIIVPSTSRIKGLEDVRITPFLDDKGNIIYYMTYTAYNFPNITPSLIETTDFIKFNMVTLNGSEAYDKDMALFPRKINPLKINGFNGQQYAMISRNDGRNLYLMFSDNIHFWDNKTLIKLPHLSWLIRQKGVCAPPIETEEGWLVIIHGVGSVREYGIGAILLDKENPSRAIKITESPILTPDMLGRSGYVPNVVYTCGALHMYGRLIIPVAVGDSYTRFCSLSMSELLNNMLPM
ncbi:hypothetical protein ACFL57_03245 [Candidatus Margulisiibacteriota bacterium]